MNIKFLSALLLPLTLFFACDDESPNKTTKDQPPVDSTMQENDMELPVQMMDFDTIEIEIDSDVPGTDLDID